MKGRTSRGRASRMAGVLLLSVLVAALAACPAMAEGGEAGWDRLPPELQQYREQAQQALDGLRESMRRVRQAAEGLREGAVELRSALSEKGQEALSYFAEDLRSYRRDRREVISGFSAIQRGTGRFREGKLALRRALRRGDTGAASAIVEEMLARAEEAREKLDGFSAALGALAEEQRVLIEAIRAWEPPREE